MNGDFSRWTFDPHRRFTGVLMQQGRVLTDADWNEQAAILLHQLRSAIADFAGPVAPIGHAFAIGPIQGADETPEYDFMIAPGHLYVDGLLCENDRLVSYGEQEHYPVPGPAKIDGTRLVYLDVWEQHLTHLQDAHLRDVALGSADTSTRTRLIWQVKLHPLESGTDYAAVRDRWDDFVECWQSTHRGSLQVRTRRPQGGETPTYTGYLGVENRLYRIEIHRDGGDGEATFKWSRQNGSVAFPIRTLAGNVATLEACDAGGILPLEPGTWVEIQDDHDALLRSAGLLAQIEAIDTSTRSVTLRPAGGATASSFEEGSTTHPVLRRWDHGHGSGQERAGGPDGGLIVEEGAWLGLEDGIEVRFEPTPARGARHAYRSGDYWIFPARTLTGDVEWPVRGGAPVAQPPHGVTHHYAPLAIITGSPKEHRFEDCLRDLRFSRD